MGCEPRMEMVISISTILHKSVKCEAVMLPVIYKFRLMLIKLSMENRLLIWGTLFANNLDGSWTGVYSELNKITFPVSNYSSKQSSFFEENKLFHKLPLSKYSWLWKPSSRTLSREQMQKFLFNMEGATFSSQALTWINVERGKILNEFQDSLSCQELINEMRPEDYLPKRQTAVDMRVCGMSVVSLWGFCNRFFNRHKR